jgi:hypothetical protein
MSARWLETRAKNKVFVVVLQRERSHSRICRRGSSSYSIIVRRDNEGSLEQFLKRMIPHRFIQMYAYTGAFQYTTYSARYHDVKS